MFNNLRRIGFAGALLALSLGMSAPAQARDRYRGGDDDAAIAIGAGIIGLAVGAAIASGNRGDRYYRDRYYRSYPQYYYQDSYPRYREYRRDYRRDWRRDNRREWRRDQRRWDRGRDSYYRRYRY